MTVERIKIVGLSDFLRDIKNATEDKSGQKLAQEANKKTGEFIIDIARREASTKAEKKAASTLTAKKAMAAVRVVGGSEAVPYFAGANFGAYRNKVRLIKARAVRDIGGGFINQKRTRATMVRGIGTQRQIQMTAQRVERQYVDTRGRTMTRKEGGQQVRLARTKSGSIRKIRGWNQFRKWSKGKDYFLFRSIQKNFKEIIEFYYEALDDATRKAFPDGRGLKKG